MNSRWWFILGCVAGAVLLGGLETSHATRSPADKCRQAKHGAASRYVTCLQRAESRYVGHKDPAARAIAVRKCAAKFDVAWIKIEAAGGSACPSAGDAAAIREVLADTAADLASRLGGGPPAGCSGELLACDRALGSCQPARLDPTFGDGGTVVGSGPARDVLLDRDGRALVYRYVKTPNAASDDLVIERYDRHGALDRTFGVNGMRVFQSPPGFFDGTVPILLADGSVVIGGSFMTEEGWRLALVRFREDGSLYEAFGQNGMAVGDLHSFGTGAVEVLFDGEAFLVAELAWLWGPPPERRLPQALHSRRPTGYVLRP